MCEIGDQDTISVFVKLKTRSTLYMCETVTQNTESVCMKLVTTTNSLYPFYWRPEYNHCRCSIGDKDTVSVYAKLMARTQYLYV